VLTTIGWTRNVKLRRREKVECLVMFASATFNLIQSPKLLPRHA
jgi:hypothetical protein